MFSIIKVQGTLQKIGYQYVFDVVPETPLAQKHPVRNYPWEYSDKFNSIGYLQRVSRWHIRNAYSLIFVNNIEKKKYPMTSSDSVCIY